MGVISSLGNSVDTNHDALIHGTCGISSLQLVKTKYAASLHFGEIKIENQQLKKNLNANEISVTRTMLLALHAFNEAVGDSSLSSAELASYDTALVAASTVGGMCLTDELYGDY